VHYASPPTIKIIIFLYATHHMILYIEDRADRDNRF